MKEIAIIGAGFSTAVLCHYLNEKNLIIFEKARGPGGRSSTRKVDAVGVFDHGLQYISPSTPEFLNFIKSVKNIKQWHGDFVQIDKKISTLPASNKFIGNFGNNDFVKSLINLEKCHFKTKIDKLNFLNDHWKIVDDIGKEYLAKKLILTIPQAQTNDLIKELGVNFEIKENNMKPCFTVMLALKETSIFKYSGYVIKNNKILSWCANETSKQRVSNNQELTLLTIQTTEDYGYLNFKKYKQNKDQILNEIVTEFLDIFKIDKSEVVHQDVHGWLFAYSENNSLPVYWNETMKIGITGDWFTGGRAENAWKNAKLMSEKLNNEI